MAKTADSPFPWEIRLINDGSINAWALPGGKMDVNYGLILAAETEAELVSVLGHEMAHSIELHGTGRETFGALIGLAAQVVEIGISEPGTKPGSNRIIGFGQNFLMGQYSQSMSREFVDAQTEIKTLESALKLVTEARKARAKEQFPKALQLIERALKILPNEHSVWRLQAELLVANQEPDQAVQSALKVRELNPKDPISELLLGYCYAASGDTLNAARAKQRARSLVL